MGVSKHTGKAENHSLTEEYQRLFSEFEKKGLDVDQALGKAGGKEVFLQRLQDLEDDVVSDPSDVFKKAYEENNIRRCVRAVVNIAKKDWYIDKRGLRKTLYSEDSLLKNPLNYAFSVDDYKKTCSILATSMHYMEQLSQGAHSDFSAEMAENYSKELWQLYLLYECMYHNRIENERRLTDSAFLNLSLPQILHSFLAFYQSQTNLAREEQVARWKTQEYITGLESQVASEHATLAPDVVVSMGDSFEQLLEDLDGLFRYLYYIKSEETETPAQDLQKMKLVSPYASPDYSMLNQVALIDTLLARLEAGFRYSGWSITVYNTPEDDEVYGFSPLDDRPYRTHVAAVLRDKQKYVMENAFMQAKRVEEHMIQGVSSDEVDETNHNCQDDLNALPGGFFGEYLPTSKRMIGKQVELFHFEKEEYQKLVALTSPAIDAVRKMSKPYFFSCTFHNMSVSEYLDAYAFLYTISKVYYCAAMIAGEAENSVRLVNLPYLYDEFASLSGYEYEKAKHLIDCFVFDKVVASRKRLGDIFTRPLVKAGSDTVLISEALIDQINLFRNIEVLLDWNDVALAPMGIELEKKLIDELKTARNLSVNTNKIEFTAYDGKNVEFDFVATIDDCLILMEMKSILKPYDDDELYRRRKTLSEGVDQIHRRVRIVQKDWDKIRASASISLPAVPYDDEHIIKVVCTDACNYTGLEIDDVVLTDDATVLKYFTNPYVQAVMNHPEKGVMMFRMQTLWTTGKPTAKEFIEYLHHPDTMDFILDCIESEWKFIPVYEGYKKIAFRDVMVKDDPWKRAAEKFQLHM